MTRRRAPTRSVHRFLVHRLEAAAGPDPPLRVDGGGETRGPFVDGGRVRREDAAGRRGATRRRIRVGDARADEYRAAASDLAAADEGDDDGRGRRVHGLDVHGLDVHGLDVHGLDVLVEAPRAPPRRLRPHLVVRGNFLRFFVGVGRVRRRPSSPRLFEGGSREDQRREVCAREVYRGGVPRGSPAHNHHHLDGRLITPRRRGSYTRGASSRAASRGRGSAIEPGWATRVEGNRRIR